MTSAGGLLTKLDYPMTIVTAAAGDERDGCLVGFFTQCSVDPPRLVVFLSEKNRTTDLAGRVEHLGVHFLQTRHRDLAELFGGESGDWVDKFARCNWYDGPEGVPVLSDVPDLAVGRVLDRFPGGDHIGHLLEVVHVEVGDQFDQLGFQVVSDMDPGHKP